MPTSFLFDGPEDARVTILLAHGAGAPMDSASMNALSSRGTVARSSSPEAVSPTTPGEVSAISHLKGAVSRARGFTAIR